MILKPGVFRRLSIPGKRGAFLHLTYILLRGVVLIWYNLSVTYQPAPTGNFLICKILAG